MPSSSSQKKRPLPVIDLGLLLGPNFRRELFGARANPGQVNVNEPSAKSKDCALEDPSTGSLAESDTKKEVSESRATSAAAVREADSPRYSSKAETNAASVNSPKTRLNGDKMLSQSSTLETDKKKMPVVKPSPSLFKDVIEQSSEALQDATNKNPDSMKEKEVRPSSATGALKISVSRKKLNSQAQVAITAAEIAISSLNRCLPLTLVPTVCTR